MTQIKCTVDNCHYWESNKCTADKIEVSKNISPGKNNMEAGRIGRFEENEENVNEEENRMGTLGRNRRDNEFGTLGDENQDINNYGDNVGSQNEAGKNNLENNRNNNERQRNENDNAFMSREEDNTGNMGTMTNLEGNEGETMTNRKQDLEAGTMGADSDSSIETKCVTFRPKKS